MATIALPRFLEKLRIITDTTPPEIASWSEDGTRYEIHDSRFETEILTQHFDAKRSLLSFIRQLNYYGFKKLENKGGKWAISHPKFQRDSPHLIYEIKRKTRKEHIVTASKDEVQSIRTEVGMMKANMLQEIDVLKGQIYFLQNQLGQYIRATSMPQNLMRFPEYENNHALFEHEHVNGTTHAKSRKKERQADEPEQKKRRKRQKRGDTKLNNKTSETQIIHQNGDVQAVAPRMPSR